MANTDRTTGTSGTGATNRGDAGDWGTDDAFWQSNYASRPYASADRSYSHYRPAYRYGYESASRNAGREWTDMESDLRSGWDRYEHRNASDKSTWEEIKDATKDAWDRVRGHGDPHRRDMP